MKIEEIPLSEVLRARAKKKMTKFAGLFDKLIEMSKEIPICVTAKDETEFRNMHSRIRKITQRLGGADVFEVDNLKDELRIYITKIGKTKIIKSK